MRIVVIGGTGLIGTKVVATLAAQGCDVVAASRATGVNSYTTEGLAEAGDDVATAVARTAVGEPTGRTAEFAGPEQFTMTALLEHELRSRKDPREGVADALARYFGNTLTERELLPDADAFLFDTRFEDWLARSPDPA